MQNYYNIYIFNVNNNKYLEFLDVSYNLNYVKSIVKKFLLDNVLSQFENKNDSALRREAEKNLTFYSEIRLIFDRVRNQLLLTEENEEPIIRNRGQKKYTDTINDIKELSSWIKENENLFGKIDDNTFKLKTMTPLSDSSNYYILKIKDLKELYVILSQTDINMDQIKDFNVLIIKDYNKGFIDKINGVIADDIVKTGQTICKNSISLDGVTLSPPTIIINKQNDSIYELEHRLYTLIVKDLKPNYLLSYRVFLNRLHEMGNDVEDLFYDTFSKENNVKKESFLLDKLGNEEEKNKIYKIIKDLDIDLNDQGALDFVKSLIVYLRTFSFDNIRKIFYSIVSYDKDSDLDPFSKNKKLFSMLFKIRSGPIDSKYKRYYLLSSKYLFPELSFNLFSNKKITLNETFCFNINNGILSKYYYDNIPKNEEELFYTTNVLRSFPRAIENLLGNSIKENRFNEKVSVKPLSEYPYAYRELKKLFDKAGVEYKDINVVMIYEPSNEDTFGGFVSDFTSTEDTMKLIEGYKDFSLPVIVINTANENMKIRSNVSMTLIHEGSHYLDYLKIKNGLAEKSMFDASYTDLYGYKTKEEQIAFFREYVKSETEQNAFSNFALSVLNRYSKEYILKNWNILKKSIIKRYLLMEDRESIVLDIPEVIEAYAPIVQRAFDMFIEQN